MKVSATTLFTASMALSLSAMALPIVPAGGVDSRTSLSAGEGDMKQELVSSTHIGTTHAVIKARDTDTPTVNSANPGLVGAIVPVVAGVQGIVSTVENTVSNLPGGSAVVGLLKGLGLKTSQNDDSSNGPVIPVDTPLTGAYLPNIPSLNQPYNPVVAPVAIFPNVVPGYAQAQGVAGLSNIPEVLPGVVDFGMGTVVPGVSMANVGQAEELAALKGSFADAPVLPDAPSPPVQAPSVPSMSAAESLCPPAAPSATATPAALPTPQVPITLVSTGSGLFLASAIPSAVVPSAVPTPSDAIAYTDGGVLIPNQPSAN